jgi:[Skp1-protein]-hydroxyproline N-acetylglucosaminyltransferase
LSKQAIMAAPRSSRKSSSKKQAKAVKHDALVFHPVFLGLFGLLSLALGISFYLVLSHPEARSNGLTDVADMNGNGVDNGGVNNNNNVNNGDTLRDLQQQQQQDENANKDVHKENADLPHLHPRLPYLPIFAKLENEEQLIEDTLSGRKPTIAGIAAVLSRFLAALHESNLKNSADAKQDVAEVIDTYYRLTKEYLQPLDEAYRDKPIFPIREDDSIFVSLAAFREHLLAQTLKSAFDQATHPDQLFIGAVVQNCFGKEVDGRQCRTGLQVVGKNAKGKDQVQQFDAPPDANGIQDFCADPKYTPYCDAGHVRVLYVHDTDALGPATARYYASKLWGGETYFLQMDSHLEFAPDWDAKYMAEVQAAKNFPKAVLSAYPPGFQSFGQYKGGSPGSRLCSCVFSESGVEDHILRINTGMACKGNEPRPTQIAFIAAGFFFARAEFLVDVPFDPYIPWCFMGEEIALSMRAWTSGWDIYAPRQNLIAHQYRPGRLGLPKFWESVGRDSGRPNLNTRLQTHIIRRIKHMVGYLDDTEALITAEGDQVVLTDIQHYSMGTERTREAYLELTNIDVVNLQCKPMKWCNHGELE